MVRRRARRFAATMRSSRSRPWKYSRSSSLYGRRPTQGEDVCAATSGGRGELLDELVERHVEDSHAAGPPELALEGRRILLDRPAEPRRSVGCADLLSRETQAVEHHAQVPIPKAVAEEEEVAIFEVVVEARWHGGLARQ